jgi:hypothetical protein
VRGTTASQEAHPSGNRPANIVRSGTAFTHSSKPAPGGAETATDKNSFAFQDIAKFTTRKISTKRTATAFNDFNVFNSSETSSSTFHARFGFI